MVDCPLHIMIDCLQQAGERCIVSRNAKGPKGSQGVWRCRASPEGEGGPQGGQGGARVAPHEGDVLCRVNGGRNSLIFVRENKSKDAVNERLHFMRACVRARDLKSWFSRLQTSGPQLWRFRGKNSDGKGPVSKMTQA